jgi:hypothetical protein
MARIPDKFLQGAVKGIEDDMRELGMIAQDERVIVEIGSKTYGRAFRLYTTGKGGTTGLSDSPLHLGDGFLGMTSEQALTSLRCIVRTLEAVKRLAVTK